MKEISLSPVTEGYRLGIKAIEELGKNMSTAFCMASDTLVIGTLQAFNERGWDISKRVAFFIDNISVAQYVSPPLTTFHIDVPLMCDTTLNLLWKDHEIQQDKSARGSLERNSRG